MIKFTMLAVPHNKQKEMEAPQLPRIGEVVDIAEGPSFAVVGISHLYDKDDEYTETKVIVQPLQQHDQPGIIAAGADDLPPDPKMNGKPRF